MDSPISRCHAVATVHLMESCGVERVRNTIDSQGQAMRPSALEPPRGNLPTRPSTSYTPGRCVRGRPDRPICGASWTHRMHLERRVLPRCCHDRTLPAVGNVHGHALAFAWEQ